MDASRKPYEPPAIADLGSIADHTFTCSADGFPPKGGGPIAHCDKHDEWSGGTGEDKGTCGCPNPGL